MRAYLLQHDGSIDDGFEIVSHPMTLDYHTDIMNWKEVFDTALSLDYRSHQTSTCGLHIHVNRSAFGKDICEQEETVARIVYFVEQHWNELLKFSRRTEASMNRWAARYGIAQNTKDTYRNAKDRCPGRYAAVNLENETTVEFRIFRGTLRYTTFFRFWTVPIRCGWCAETALSSLCIFLSTDCMSMPQPKPFYINR